MTTKYRILLVLAGSILASACTMNQAERRATTGGMIGAGAGAAGGYMLGYDPVAAGLLGGAGGALLGAITTPDSREVHHHYHDDRRYYYEDRRPPRRHPGKHGWQRGRGNPHWR